MALRRLVPLAAALALLASTTGAVAAKNDHRVFLEAEPFDYPAEWCGFVIHAEVVKNQEYATVTTLPDGSTQLKGNGSLFLELSNPANLKSVTVNASGPFTLTFSADNEHLTDDGTGLTHLAGPNLTDFGYPSNAVLLAGPVHFEQNHADAPAFADVSGGNVIRDVCAELA